MTETLGIVYLTGLGAALGSFLNVCIYRWPAGESVIRPRSRCPVCGTAVAWYDNIPVLSWLILRGRCRGCRTRISVQYPLVELAAALIWLGMALWLGPGIEAVRGAVLLTLLLGIAIIDARHRIIPDQFSLGGTFAGLLLAAWPGGIPIATALLGALVGYVFMWLVKLGGEALFRKPALGVGDIHMMAMIGAFVGIGGALLTILLGSILGLLIGVPVAWAQGKLEARGTYLPLGTFLAMGAAVAYLWGEPIIAWYLGYVLPA
ncbi:MAG TPA: prepilin peptidase [Longimicrobiales bacterium]|nr:prepilin peptidase [Longimicrobiales bacterium]